MSDTIEERIAVVETKVGYIESTVKDVKDTQTTISGKIDGIATTLAEQKGAKQVKKEQWAIMAVLSSVISAVTAVAFK